MVHHEQNQTFVFLAIECVLELILEGFWSRDGGVFGSQMAFRSDFESKCYKVCKSGGAEVVWQPPP